MSAFSNVSLPGDSSAQYKSVGEGIGVLDFGQANVDNANVLFYLRSVPDPEASARYGRPMEKAIEYVRIQQPMTRDCTDQPVANAQWAIARYPRQWAQYQKSQQQIPDGSPISVLFPQNPEIVANLKQFGVYTVEQLAGALDADLQNLPIGGTQMRDRARKYIEVANKGVALHQLQAALADRDNKIEVLTNQMAQMQGAMNQLLSERQGVPKAMIPQAPPPIAQAHAMSLPQLPPAAPIPTRPWTPSGDVVEVTTTAQQAAWVPPPAPAPTPPGKVPGWSHPPAPPPSEPGVPYPQPTAPPPQPVKAPVPPAAPVPSQPAQWAAEASDVPQEAVQQSVVGPSITEPPKARRGWPKGKPRKPLPTPA